MLTPLQWNFWLQIEDCEFFFLTRACVEIVSRVGSPRAYVLHPLHYSVSHICTRVRYFNSLAIFGLRKGNSLSNVLLLE